MSAAAFLRQGALLAELLPLRRLEVASADRSGELAETARQIAEVGLTDLEFDLDGESPDTVAALFGRLSTGRLRRLIVNNWSEETVLLGPLLAWPGLAKLTGLRILDLSSYELLPLLTSPAVGPLEWLDLGDATFGPAAWSALAANDRLVGLRHVVLGKSDEREHGAGRALAKARWSRLENFGLMAIEESADDLGGLLAAQWTAGIHSLWLCLGAYSPAASRALGQACLPQLNDLTLAVRQHGPAWVSDLCASGLAPNLGSLHLRTNDYTAVAIANGAFGRLRRLSLNCLDAASACAWLIPSSWGHCENYTQVERMKRRALGWHWPAVRVYLGCERSRSLPCLSTMPTAPHWPIRPTSVRSLGSTCPEAASRTPASPSSSMPHGCQQCGSYVCTRIRSLTTAWRR